MLFPETSSKEDTQAIESSALVSRFLALPQSLDYGSQRLAGASNLRGPRVHGSSFPLDFETSLRLTFRKVRLSDSVPVRKVGRGRRRILLVVK